MPPKTVQRLGQNDMHRKQRPEAGRANLDFAQHALAGEPLPAPFFATRAGRRTHLDTWLIP
jgi:hypothetical protein